jgi:serine/threonine protein kinase
MSKNLFGNRWEKIKAEPFGQGGQGSIYLVKDINNTLPDKVFALKKLNNPKRLPRFRQEIETIQELNKTPHPGIFPIIDYSLDQEPFYFVTEYYGDDILSKKAPLEVTEALTIFIKICETISYIHEKNIIHRDLKPDNIVLNNGQPIILDFGLCFNLNDDFDSDINDTDERLRITETIEQIGSRYYIPPELENGRLDQISKKSDSYTLGKILYFLLTVQVFAREEYPDLAKLLSDYQLNYVTQRILSKTLTVDVESRLTSAELTIEAIKIKKLIKGGFYPNKVNSVCRFCGEGVYEDFQKGFLKTSVYSPPINQRNPIDSYHAVMRSASDSAIPFESIACNLCGHLQFFKKNPSEL